MDRSESDAPKREPLNSSRSGKFIANRVKEMSQLESPGLRELAFRLGNMLNIETPTYEPKCRDSPSHLKFDIGDRWQVLQGCNDWKGLLDPIDPALKAEIIRYGEFAQATYDAFDKSSHSSTSGDSKYDKESLLKSLGFASRGYEITNFLYATTNLRLSSYLNSVKRSMSSSSGSSEGDKAEYTSKQSNWIGFVAVCTAQDEIHRLGRRDIVIAWRGTCGVNEWIADITDYMSPAGFGPKDDCSHVRVQAGFKSVYTSKNPGSQHNKTTSARDQVMDAIKSLVQKYKHEGKLSITVTGHSLGSALATLCAYDIAESDFNMLSDSPTAPHQWSSEDSPTEAKSNEDRHVRHPHVESVKNLMHSVFHHDKEDDNSHEDVPLRHPHTAAVTNFLHSKLHHNKEDGQRIMKDVKNFFGNKDEAELNEFPQGKVPITVYSFAGPRVGNRNFQDRIQELGVAVLRVVNVHDLVPALPGLKPFSTVAAKLHKIMPHLPSFKHVGVKLEVDNSKSVFLKSPASLGQAHSLEAYLHLVDTYRGRYLQYAGPQDQTFRDYALVNKTTDFLRPEYYIPPFWKDSTDVARDSNGNWQFPGRSDWALPKASNTEEEFADFWQNIDEAAARSNVAMPRHSS